MSKIYVHYEQIYSYATLLEAWRIVCQDERYSGDKVLFGSELEHNLLIIQERLLKCLRYALVDRNKTRYV